MRFHSAALVLFLTHPIAAGADEVEDIQTCIGAVRDATNTDIQGLDAEWKPYIFSPNRVEFPSSDVICDISMNGVVTLTQGDTIYIQDGWPVGREMLFDNLDKEIETEKERLRKKTDELSKIQNDSKRELQVYSNDPQAIINLARETVANIIEIELTATEESAVLKTDNLLREIQVCQSELENTLKEFASCKSEINERDLSAKKAQAQSEAYERIIQAVNNASFAEANLIWDQYLQNANTSSEALDKLEADVRSSVGRIPSSELSTNRDGYLLLTRLKPDTASYSEKLKLYQGQIDKEKTQLIEHLCKAVIIFKFPPLSANEIGLSTGEHVRNPRDLKSPLIAEYNRRSDGQKFRFLCGINGEQIVVSGLSSDNSPTRVWTNPHETHPTIKYRIVGDKVVFTESYYDGSKLTEEHSLK